MGVQAAPATKGASSRSRRRARGDEGAVLVEFALIAPLLFLLIFGIIEFGWLFAQHLDVRHAAREGARLAAVNYGQDEGIAVGNPQRDAIIALTCEKLSFVDPADASVRIVYVDHDSPADASNDREQGGFVEVEVEANFEQLTGFLEFALDNVSIDSQAETRLERGDGDPPTATFNETTGLQACP